MCTVTNPANPTISSYPFRFGYYRNPSDEGGVMLNYTMLPAVLSENGFHTHAIGKVT